jgi:hypothetical protein
MLAAWSLAPKLQGATYYIDPSGSNGNSGTSIGSEWGTFDFAIGQLSAGDTLFVRGGQYSIGSTVLIDHGGTSGSPINMWAYQDEMPILDFSAQIEDEANRGILMSGNADWWHIKGLTIQKAGDNGLYTEGNFGIFERLVTRENRDSGFQLHGMASNNLVLNSDSYLNFDPDKNGEDADGFAVKHEDIGPGNIFRGNRAWANSDDGWDTFRADANGVLIQDSWSFDNGFDLWSVGVAFAGDGTGYKLGKPGGEHVLANLLAVDNAHNGVDINENGNGVEVYNTTSFSNLRNWQFDADTTTHILKNNISFGGSSSDNFTSVDPASETNSWDPGFFVSGADFLSTSRFIGPIDLLMQPRQSDGSLPDLGDFLKLAPGSDLIDSGTVISFTFNGQVYNIPYSSSAPDLGAFEFGVEVVDDVWKDPVSGSWGTGSNWEDGSTPTDSNTANFDESGTYAVTFDADPDAIRALTVSASQVTFTSSGGARTLAVNSASGSQDVLVDGGATVTLGTAGNPLHLTVGDQLTVEGGGSLSVTSNSDLSANGNVLIGAGGAGDTGVLAASGSGSTITQSGAGTLTIGSSVGSSASLVVDSSAVVSTGTGDITVNPSGSILISSSGVLNANGDLTLDGGLLSMAPIVTGTFNLAAGKTVTVQNGGTIDLQSVYTTAPNATYEITGQFSKMSSNSLVIRDGAAVNVEAMGTLETTLGILTIGTAGTSGTLTADGSGTTVSATGSGASHTWGAGGGDAFVTFSGGAEGNFGNLNLADSSTAGTSATVDVVSGGELNVTRLFIARLGGTTTSATLNIQGAGSSVTQGAIQTSTIGHASTGTAVINIGTTESGASFTNTAGAITINATGTVSIGSASTTGTFDASGAVTINGTVNLAGGTMYARDTLTIDPAGNFNFTGGTLHAIDIVGTLENYGGTLEPGFSVGTLAIAGDYTQGVDSRLRIELGDNVNDFDKLQLTGTATLDGILEVVLGAYVPQLNDPFEIITAGVGIVGEFNEEDLSLPELDEGLDWELIYDTTTVTLKVVGPEILIGDYNGDGKVSAADYTVWRDTLGSTTDLRANGDDSNSVIDEDDYQVWLDNYGMPNGIGAGATGSASVAVPEPGTLVLVVLAGLVWARSAARRG